MKFYFYSSVFLILTLFSCVAKQELYFEKDLSGNAKLTMDMSQMMEMMGEIEEKSVLVDSANQIKIEKLKKLKGISNVKTDDANFKISSISFDFSSIEVLNNAANTLTKEESEEKFNYFTQVDKKNIEINFPPQQSGEESDNSMLEQFIYNLEINAKAKIKSFDSNCLKTSKKGNSIIVNSTMLEMTDPKNCKKITIKFK